MEITATGPVDRQPVLEFLDRVATQMLAFGGDSHVEWFAGNYTEYEADRKRRLGDAEPSRVKYKPISRA